MKLPASKAIGVGLALMVGLGVLVLWPRTPPRPEELIRHEVISLTAAAEQKQLATVMEKPNVDWEAAEGEMGGGGETLASSGCNRFQGVWWCRLGRNVARGSHSRF